MCYSIKFLVFKISDEADLIPRSPINVYNGNRSIRTLGHPYSLVSIVVSYLTNDQVISLKLNESWLSLYHY